MNEAKLKACPFCGSTKVSVGTSWDGKGQHRYQVECEECEAFGPSTEHKEHVAEARWNDRAGDREQEAAPNAGNIAGSFQRMVSPLPDTAGRLQQAKRFALMNYDHWNEVTGVPHPHTSYYYEIASIVEDAVEYGYGVAHGQTWKAITRRIRKAG